MNQIQVGVNMYEKGLASSLLHKAGIHCTFLHIKEADNP